MKLAVLMDPVANLNPHKDTTLAILQAAHDLGWFAAYFTQHDLTCRNALVSARLRSIAVGDLNQLPWADIGEPFEGLLSEFDIILMRKDPPFNMEYIHATYALELAEKAGVLVANKPQSLRDANEKFFTLQFPQCCPPTIVSNNQSVLREFWQKEGNVIFKPLDSMGGSSIFHVDKKGTNLAVILELLTEGESKTIMAQRYIPAITEQGDKRILLINGEPVPYALARIPAKGEIRGNLAAGGRGKVVALSKQDRFICEEIAPTLKAKGLYFVGIDVIGDYLTEINVTSPTCLQEITKETGLTLAKDYLNALAAIYSVSSST